MESILLNQMESILLNQMESILLNPREAYEKETRMDPIATWQEYAGGPHEECGMTEDYTEWLEDMIKQYIIIRRDSKFDICEFVPNHDDKIWAWDTPDNQFIGNYIGDHTVLDSDGNIRPIIAWTPKVD